MLQSTSSTRTLLRADIDQGVIPCFSNEHENSAIGEFSPNICDLAFRAKDKFSIIDKNVRRSSRTFDVRQEMFGVQ